MKKVSRMEIDQSCFLPFAIVSACGAFFGKQKRGKRRRNFRAITHLPVTSAHNTNQSADKGTLPGNLSHRMCLPCPRAIAWRFLAAFNLTPSHIAATRGDCCLTCTINTCSFSSSHEALSRCFKWVTALSELYLAWKEKEEEAKGDMEKRMKLFALMLRVILHYCEHSLLRDGTVPCSFPAGAGLMEGRICSESSSLSVTCTGKAPLPCEADHRNSSREHARLFCRLVLCALCLCTWSNLKIICKLQYSHLIQLWTFASLRASLTGELIPFDTLLG